jgi:hypothetical protein
MHTHHVTGGDSARRTAQEAGARAAAAASALLIAISGCGTAFAQKPGGILRMPWGDSPASMSIHEESAIIAERAMME